VLDLAHPPPTILRPWAPSQSSSCEPSSPMSAAARSVCRRRRRNAFTGSAGEALLSSRTAHAVRRGRRAGAPDHSRPTPPQRSSVEHGSESSRPHRELEHIRALASASWCRSAIRGRRRRPR
jgi:hypothetical protein